MSEIKEFIGGCFCGNIRYVATAVFDAGYCHCSMCRRFSGAPASAWFNVRDEDFALTAGAPSQYRSSEHFSRYFCSVCGTHVFGRDDRPPSPKVGSRLVSVMLGTLDDPESVRPKVHQWWSLRMSWYTDALNLLTFDSGTITHPATRQ